MAEAATPNPNLPQPVQGDFPMKTYAELRADVLDKMFNLS